MCRNQLEGALIHCRVLKVITFKVNQCEEFEQCVAGC